MHLGAIHFILYVHQDAKLRSNSQFLSFSSLKSVSVQKTIVVHFYLEIIAVYIRLEGTTLQCNL